ncbi:MAG: tRNA lysidine(34) synthetase TilS [Steroidobacterales bacterium]
MSFSAASLGAVLDRLVPSCATGLVIGLSGGLDSSCLATALAELAALPGALPAALPVRAVHVDHGLQSAATAFREQAAALCRRLGVELTIVTAPVGSTPGASIEAAARDARYAALAAQLQAGECLLTAHHCQDQAETFLLQALRGAGPKGLAGMPPRRALGAGWHLRPLLAVPRRDLRRFAARHGIGPEEDPMNLDARFDRAFLRHQVWPLLEQRWPGAGIALARAAQHSADALQLLDSLADQDLAGIRDGEALAVTRLRRLNEARRLNAVRRWLVAGGAALPSTARLTEALRQMLGARGDHQPAVVWAGHALRRYRDRMFLTTAQPPRLLEPRSWDWRTDPVLELGEELGCLRIVARTAGLAPGKLGTTLLVRARAGGERMRIAVSGRARSVQHLCQDRGVLPWLRDALPFIYADAELIAVADLWSSAAFHAAPGAPGLAFAWEHAPLVC